MSGSGVTIGQPTPADKGATALPTQRPPKQGQFLPRTPLPHANISQSEAQLRALGLTGRLTDTVLRGNSEAFAESIYRKRGPEAMKVRREALEVMQKNPQFTQMPQGVKELIEEKKRLQEQIEEKKRLAQQENQEKERLAQEKHEEKKRLAQEQTLQAEINEKPSALHPLRITGENIYWGQHRPSKVKEIIWGGHIFNKLPVEQKKNISRLSNIIHSGNSTVVNVNEYKISLDNLIRLNSLTYDTVETIVSNKLMLFNPNIIKGYWNRYNRFDYSIEPDEIYFFIFDWISKNTIFTEEPYIIFPLNISDAIRSILEESRVASPEQDPYPEFNERKREFIRRLYYSPDGDSQTILNSFMDQEEQNRFKPRLSRELIVRETQANKIYKFADLLSPKNPDIVIEDCKLLWYQLIRITQRMRKLYPLYKDEEVYTANQSRSIIDFFLQKKLVSEFIEKSNLTEKQIKQKQRILYCENSRYFFENTAQGNCGLDSIAQIYAPYDITENQQFTQYTVPISIRLRQLLTMAYTKAQNDIVFRNIDGIGFPRPGIITEIDGTQRTLQEYAEHISRDRIWTGDDDIKILMWLLGKIPYKYIAPEIANQAPIDIDFGKNRTDYTICNLAGRHWRLKKGGPPRNWDNDLLHAENILRLSGEEIIRLEQDERRRVLPHQSREVVAERVARAALQELPASPEAEQVARVPLQELPALPASPLSPEAAAVAQRVERAALQELPASPLSPEAAAVASAVAASGVVGIEKEAAVVAIASAGDKKEFDSLRFQMKQLAITYRTTELECFTGIEYLHKNTQKENIKGGSKTRKNKRKY
jgi:hypothetical protein